MSGQLGSVSNEEMQNLASKAGRSVPTTPMEGSVLGGNKDQAKMMGSKASLQSTFRNLGQTPESLQTAQRREQVRRDATAEEQSGMTKASNMEKLSSLDSRVQNLTTQLINNAAQNQQASQVNLSEAGQALDSDAQAALQTLQTAAPNSPEALQATQLLNQKLGRTAGTLLTADELKNNYQSIAQTVGQNLANSVSDTMTVSQLDLPSMGFSNSQELADLLGLPADQLDNLNIADLQQKINSTIQSEYSKVNELEQKANDPTLSAAERAQARKALREAGAVGVRSTESAMDNLADQIEDANTVEYAGQEYQIDELLDDETLSGLAAKYLDEENPDQAWKDKFKEDNADLAEWLDSNKEALGDAVKNIDDNVKEYAAIQDYNKNLKKTSSGQELSDEAMAAIVPGYGELSTQRVDVNANPILSVLQGEDKTKSANLASSINTLAKEAPELVTELTGLTPQQLQATGVLYNDQKWQNFTQYTKDANKIASIPQGDTQGFFSELMGKSVDLNTLQSDINEVVNRERSGFFSESPLTKFMDSLVGPDGKVLPLNQIEANLRQKVQGKSVQDLLSNPNSVVSLSDKLGGIDSYKAQSSADADLYDKVKGAFQNDNKLDLKEYNQIRANLTDISDLNKLYDKTTDSSVRNEIISHAYNKKYPDLESGIKSSGLLTRADLGVAKGKDYWVKTENYNQLLDNKDKAVQQLDGMMASAKKGSPEYQAIDRYKKELLKQYEGIISKASARRQELGKALTKAAGKAAEKGTDMAKPGNAVKQVGEDIVSGAKSVGKGIASGGKSLAKSLGF